MVPSVFLEKHELIEQELKMDLYYDRIASSSLMEELAELAWTRGIEQGKRLKGNDINELILSHGIKVEVDELMYSFKYAIFSTCAINSRTITLYKRNIQQVFIPLIPDKYSQWKDYEKAISLFLCHEYFHFLEANCIGWTSAIKKIDVRFGLIKLKRELKALSEIAAHAFVKEFYNIW
ncbi:hypothetical protein JOD02_002022 [Caldicoprobacter guelmensis]|uniref:hypothetical protein n=1 Tax=Caldicoprobacter guelmensis TaxID=1170224 RepID=UPI00195CA187|nr:hypothetical protein [Caldicoprobacter guelmensis]MBM7583145.1 hypothetical protein [Caldicoprobacter guelmensis]